MTLTYSAVCGTGIVRSENQDNLYANGIYRDDISVNADFKHHGTTSDCGLYAVADGMGGEKHGELASLIAVQAMSGIHPSAGSMGIIDYLFDRNAVICDLIKENGGARIGSTFAGLFISGKTADIANIGDSRIYLYRREQLNQLSLDHTPVRKKVELGLISDTAARSHPDRHKLTQHLGIFPSEMIIEPYANRIDIEHHDIFLLCSDGLTDMLDDAEIKSILNTPGAICEKAEALFNAAMLNGGKDNITVLLVRTD